MKNRGRDVMVMRSVCCLRDQPACSDWFKYEFCIISKSAWRQCEAICPEWKLNWKWTFQQDDDPKITKSNKKNKMGSSRRIGFMWGNKSQHWQVKMEEICINKNRFSCSLTGSLPHVTHSNCQTKKYFMSWTTRPMLPQSISPVALHIGASLNISALPTKKLSCLLLLCVYPEQAWAHISLHCAVHWCRDHQRNTAAA